MSVAPALFSLIPLLSVSLALLLDYRLGEPRRLHPLVGFGGLAKQVEHLFNSGPWRRLWGVVAWLLVVMPGVVLAALIELWLEEYFYLQILMAALVVYLAIGWRSLIQHAEAIVSPLQAGDMAAARAAVAMIVSRDSDSLDETGVAGAATESVLENGADAVFAAIFWFLLAGIPGVVLYRLANTLDAMWGYKTPRYRHFGWFAARVDDLLNLIPARLTALSYALMGSWVDAMAAWKQQGRQWKSPNAGPVMASGAGALRLRLGGTARYHDQLQERPVLGLEQGDLPSADSVTAACGLVNRVLGLWLVVLAMVCGLAVFVAL